jgi:hypothetical protein
MQIWKQGWKNTRSKKLIHFEVGKITQHEIGFMWNGRANTNLALHWSVIYFNFDVVFGIVTCELGKHRFPVSWIAQLYI